MRHTVLNPARPDQKVINEPTIHHHRHHQLIMQGQYELLAGNFNADATAMQTMPAAACVMHEGVHHGQMNSTGFG